MKPPQSNPPDRSGSKTEAFKVATGAAVKAISGHRDTTITYTPAASNQRTATTVGNEVRLPMPPQKLTPDTVVRLRGAADAMALRMKHHNAAVHAHRLPTGQ